MSLSRPDQLAINDESQYWSVHTATNGKTYYFNKKTQESKWEKPQCLKSQEEKEVNSDWQEYSTAEGKVFYYNTKLKKSVWKMPQELKDQREKQQKHESKKKQEEEENKEVQERRRREKEDEERKHMASRQFKDYMKESNIKVSMRWDEAQSILTKSEHKWNIIKQISEKKRLFQDYIQELKKKERKDKEDQIVNARDDFFKMLEESDLTSESKWHKCVYNFVKDGRYKKIEDRLRETYFQDYLDDLYTQEKENRKKAGKEQQKIIREKIKNSSKYSSDYTWEEFTKDFEDDSNFKNMHLYDRITAFSDAISEIEKEEFRKENDTKRKSERVNRENFRLLLREKIRNDQMDHKYKYRQFVQENQNDKAFISLLGQRGTTPHEFFQDEIITLKQQHADLKPEIKDFLKQTQFILTAETTFKEFAKHVSEGISTFKNLELDYQYYFFHQFTGKVCGKNKAKDALKKEKKLRKIRKRFFKVMRVIRNVTEKSTYEQFEAQINKAASQNPKVQKIKPELREKLFEEYIQNHLKTESKMPQEDDDSDSDDEPTQNMKRKSPKMSDEEPEVSKKTKYENERRGRKYSRSNSVSEKKEGFRMGKVEGRNQDEIEEEGEIQEDRERRKNKEKKSKKDKKRKRSRSRSYDKY